LQNPDYIDMTAAVAVAPEDNLPNRAVISCSEPALKGGVEGS
jgi:hypothetical protein